MPSPNHHLLNTSWTLHRLSPLHHGKEFQSLLDNPVALKTYATRFRDQLTGIAFPGVVSSAEDDSLSRTGALKDCAWEILPHLSLLDDSPPTLPNPDSGDFLAAGIAVTLQYENITYKAALVAPVSGDGTLSPALAGEGLSTSDRRKGKGRANADGSTHLPLLMTRFPNPLRQTFVSFLSANFDTYVSNLRLSSTFMCSALQIYLGVLDASLNDPEYELEHGNGHGREEARSTLFERLVKELQITVTFSAAVAPELRSLNVSVPRKALGGILLSVDGSGSGPGSSSVLKGLSDYIHKHLAMDLDLAGTSENSALVKQHVRVSKIACAAFNIAGEGRVKLVGQSVAGRPAGAPAGEEDEEGDAGGGGDDDVSLRRRVGLRANEALLHAVVRRAAVSGENQAS